MNYAIVLRLLSYILLTEGALLLLPAVASLCYGEWFVMGVFLFTAALSALAGAMFHRVKAKSQIGAVLAAHQCGGCCALCADRLHPEPGGCAV